MTAAWATGVGVGRCLHLWDPLSGSGGVWNTEAFYALLLCPSPGPILSVCQPLRSDCPLPLQLDSGGGTPTLHAVKAADAMQYRTDHTPVLLFPLPVPSLPAAPMHPPSESRCTKPQQRLVNPLLNSPSHS